MGDGEKSGESIAINFNNVNICALALELKYFLGNLLYFKNYKRY